MWQHHVALVLGKLLPVTSEVSLPLSEVIMSRLAKEERGRCARLSNELGEIVCRGEIPRTLLSRLSPEGMV